MVRRYPGCSGTRLWSSFSRPGVSGQSWSSGVRGPATTEGLPLPHSPTHEETEAKGQGLFRAHSEAGVVGKPRARSSVMI